MAAIIGYRRMQRRNRLNIRRYRIFRDRTHPFEVFSDAKVYQKFRFYQQDILQLTDEIEESLELDMDRKCALTPLLQVLITFWYCATGMFQHAVGDLIGVSQATVSRTITRVTEALLRLRHNYIRMPTQREANLSKVKFFNIQRFPNTFACIDGTHVPIQAPSEQEHEFVNRKNFHSINVQVVCDADLLFINVVANWPGQVHDARVLRQSPLFEAFERNQRLLQGIILGDSGYMLRPWLMTPLRNPRTRKERQYNDSHSSTPTTIERCIGVAKQRFHCLRAGLRLEPKKACKVIVVCLMLHNRARRSRLPPPPPDSSESELSSSSSESDDDFDEDNNPGNATERERQTERGRTAAGKVVRDRIIMNF